MSRWPPMPDDVVAYPSQLLRCPWCGSMDIEEARLRLGDLRDAWSEGQLGHAPRSPDGLPGDYGLVGACPDCERPFLVALQTDADPDNAPKVRLLAVRTGKDVQLRPPGAFR